MATDGLLSFVIFLYADGEIQWATGSASGGTDGLGGTPAQVGFDAGDGIRYFTVPGSQTDEIINIASTSNVNIPGMWIFRIDGREVIAAGCQIVTATDDGMSDICSYPRKVSKLVIVLKYINLKYNFCHCLKTTVCSHICSYSI